MADSVVGANPDFGIGKAVEAIRAGGPSYAHVVVDLARRDQVGNQMDAFAVNPAANQTNLTAKYRGLRFDHAANGSRTSDLSLQIITLYDQIWVFGFAPVGDRTLAVDDDELQALTRWMDERNGGVFATGIAGTMGATLAMRIPRVSTMRHWAKSAAPSPSKRTKGLRSGVRPSGGRPPQDGHLQLPRTQVRDGGLLLSSIPHPVLCGGSELGLIDVLPDRSHESWVYEDADVAVDGTTPTGTAEYPMVGATWEMPRAISWASTAANPTTAESGLDRTLPETASAPERKFAFIGVYDGHQSGVGRVVVDSTWHHWMDINLLGLKAAATSAMAEQPTLAGARAKSEARQAIANYEKIVRYFVNIAIWLAPPSKQRSMLYAATWRAINGAEVSRSLAATTATDALGSLAADALARQVGPCQLDDWVCHFPFEGPPRQQRLALPLDQALRDDILGHLVKELQTPLEGHPTLAPAVGAEFSVRRRFAG